MYPTSQNSIPTNMYLHIYKQAPVYSQRFYLYSSSSYFFYFQFVLLFQLSHKNLSQWDVLLKRLFDHCTLLGNKNMINVLKFPYDVLSANISIRLNCHNFQYYEIDQTTQLVHTFYWRHIMRQVYCLQKSASALNSIFLFLFFVYKHEKS